MADDPYAMLGGGEAKAAMASHVHVIDKAGKFRCETEKKAKPWTAQTVDPRELVLDNTHGFIPLWAPNVTLRWRWRPGTLNVFQDPEQARLAIEGLLAEAIGGWGDAAPIKFAKGDVWDFEIVVKAVDDCNASGCVLAQAFFPDAGQHKLYIWPKMFTQSRAEQIETLQHEIGHVFGLRHFFALQLETNSPAVLFGTQNKFTIMNYGDASTLTDADRNDLKTLYAAVWSGQLTKIGNSDIKQVRPYHETAPQGAFAMAAAVG